MDKPKRFVGYTDHLVVDSTKQQLDAQIGGLCVSGTRARAQAVLIRDNPNDPVIHAHHIVPAVSRVAWSLLQRGDDLDCVESLAFFRGPVGTHLDIECQRGGDPHDFDGALVKARFITKKGESITAYASSSVPLPDVSSAGRGFVHPFSKKLDGAAYLHRNTNGLVAHSPQRPLGSLAFAFPNHSNFLHTPYWTDTVARIGIHACEHLVSEGDDVLIHSISGLVLPSVQAFSDSPWGIFAFPFSEAKSKRGYPLFTIEVAFKSDQDALPIGGGYVTFVAVPSDFFEKEKF